MKHNKSAGNHSKVDEDWINPKKSIPATCFFKKCKNEEENAKVSNECSMLIDEHDDDEEEDDEMKFYEIKEEASGCAIKRNDENNEAKATRSNGVSNEIEEDHEAECEKHEAIQENSALTEVMCEMLVSEIKSDLLTLKVHSEDEDFESEEKFCEEVDEKRTTVDERQDIENVKISHAGERIWGKDATEMMTETTKIKELEVKMKLRDKRKEDSELDDNLSVSESCSRDEESEHEHGDSLDELFDG